MTVTVLGSIRCLSPVSRERVCNADFWCSKSNQRRRSYRRLTAIKSVRSKNPGNGGTVENPYSKVETAHPDVRKSLSDFLEEVRDFVGDGGPPRWFSPLECGAQTPDSPLLLFLPGVDDTRLGLVRHHKKLGEIFDIWCLHIPVRDRTPAKDLVKLIERTVRLEKKRFPNKPIYLVGESIGACLALDVAARNPNMDLSLILANPDPLNPKTSFPRAPLSLPKASVLLIDVGDHEPFRKLILKEKLKVLVDGTSPVMLSTLENGRVVRSLDGLPSEGPVMYVGYHMLLGFELVPMITHFLKERNIHLRGLAHPLIYRNYTDSIVDERMFEKYRILGGVPVSNFNIYKLLQLKSHVLLYPGGIREALHRKGEEYKLFWPERPEFVRVASKFGAKIVPFGVIGEDDICDIILDSNDQKNIPFLNDFIERTTKETGNLREGDETELGDQVCHIPGIVPKIPGRFYYYFGKPIETAGKERELGDKKKAQALYLQVKSEVEQCIAYLKIKRETGPYRNLLPRILYQASHGCSSEIPTFHL